MVGVDTGAGGGAGVGKDIKRYLQIKATTAQYSITLHPQKKEEKIFMHCPQIL